MSDIKIVIGAEAGQAISEIKKTNVELGKTAAASTAASSAFKGVGTQISSLGSSLISGGVITGIALLGGAFIKAAQDTFALSKEAQRLNDVLSESKSAYVKATLEVEKLQVAFNQAKSGVISKDEALKLYNSTVGKTIGQTKDLDEAERIFTAQAENYIKFTLLKAAANIALGKAAEAAFKAEQARIEGIKTTEIGTGEGLLLLLKQQIKGISATSVLKKAEELQQDRINKAVQEEADFRKIATSLQAQANAFGFDYNGILAKDVKLQKEKTKEVKKQTDAIIALPTTISGLDKPVALESAKISIREFEFFAQDNEAVGRGLQKLIDQQNLEKFQQTATDSINNAFANIISDVLDQSATAIGEALAGEKNVLPNLFEGIISSIGSQVKELGKFLVKTGVEMLVAKKAIEKLGLSPQTAIIAGFALQILGSALAAGARKKFNTSKFASGTTALGAGTFATIGERGPENVFLPRGSSVQPNNEAMAFGSGGDSFVAETRISLTELVIGLKRAEAKLNRNGSIASY